jgi:hypothetical protein
VGRYDTGKKNLLLLHDVDLNILISGPDADKIRAITRGETTTAKIHSSVTILPPLFVIITSNGRLLDHRVKEKALVGPHEFSVLLYSKLNASGNGGRKRDEEMVNAIKNRFLECHIRARPANRMDNFKRLGTFQRMHFILAVFPRIVQLLEKYKPSDFYSEALYFYALSGLKLNVDFFDDFYRFTLATVASANAAAAAASTAPPGPPDASSLPDSPPLSPILKPHSQSKMPPPPMPPTPPLILWHQRIAHLERAATAASAAASCAQAELDLDVADLGANLMDDWSK